MFEYIKKYMIKRKYKKLIDSFISILRIYMLEVCLEKQCDISIKEEKEEPNKKKIIIMITVS